MSCSYQSLYYGEEGYVVRCNQCSHYQLAFISTMLTMSAAGFHAFYSKVKCLAFQSHTNSNQDAKTILLGTPSPDVHFVLSPTELKRLHQMLEEADNEKRVQDLLYLFKIE